jgi:pyridoxamine 5'-phosphate oxidase
MIFGKQEKIASLSDVLNQSWRLLHSGVGNFRHPFYRPSLATMDDNRPEVRTVILRGFSEKERTLICYCDSRSPKISQIRSNPNVSWLFYHPKMWLQLRLSGPASVHTDDEEAESQWKRVRRTSRINYCSEFTPGSRIEKPTLDPSRLFRDKASKLIDHQEARKNFAIIVCRFDQMDWLLLKLTGHLRARFHWMDHLMEASWVVP